MKFSAACISFAITLLAAASIQAAPILGSNGNGVAQITNDRIDVPAGTVHVDSEQVKVGGADDDAGVDRVLSDVTQETLGENTTLRKRTDLVGDVLGEKVATGASQGGLVEKLVGSQGGPVEKLVGSPLSKRTDGSDIVGGAGNGVTDSTGGDLNGLVDEAVNSLKKRILTGTQGQQKAGLVGEVVHTAGNLVDGQLVKRSGDVVGEVTAGQSSETDNLVDDVLN